MNILVATNNEDKAEEILRVLSAEFSADVIVQTLKQAGINSDPEENGKTFAENACIKAYATRDAIVAAERSDLSDHIIIADDSGLCVDALNGEPGIHSARFAEGGQDDSAHAEYADNNVKLIAVLRDVPADKRTAYFVTAACVLVPNADARDVDSGDEPTQQEATQLYTEHNLEAQLHGHIGFEPIGENGFGYDPMFFPEEYDGKLTNAQLTPEQKSAISHRGKAIRKVAELLKTL